MKKVLLEAPILTNSGYGEHSRLVFRSIFNLSTEYEIYVNPLRWGTTSWSSIPSKERDLIDQCIVKNARYNKDAAENPQYDIQIHVGIPSEFQKKAPYSVCVTAGIETDLVSSDWIIQTSQFARNGPIDKLIVPSSHSKSSFVSASYQAQLANGENLELTLDCPIEVVPYPVKPFDPSSEIELPIETEFNFLTVSMWGIRKNLENTIRWFIEEFRDDEDTGLILKTNLSKNCFIDRAETYRKISSIVQSCGKKKCKVHLLHGNLTNDQLHSLYRNEKVKAYLTATHGEGYGLPIFEAAYSGLPIIATDWSAHLDFLTAPVRDKKTGKTKMKKLFSRINYSLKNIQKEAVWDNILVKESKWAFPEERSFKEQIRKLKKQYGFYKKRATTLKKHIEKTHKEEDIKKKMAMAIFSPVGLTEDSIKEASSWDSDISLIEEL